MSSKKVVPELSLDYYDNAKSSVASLVRSFAFVGSLPLPAGFFQPFAQLFFPPCDCTSGKMMFAEGSFLYFLIRKGLACSVRARSNLITTL